MTVHVAQFCKIESFGINFNAQVRLEVKVESYLEFVVLSMLADKSIDRCSKSILFIISKITRTTR